LAVPITQVTSLISTLNILKQFAMAVGRQLLLQSFTGAVHIQNKQLFFIIVYNELPGGNLG